MIRELAPAKVNLLLHVGEPRPDGLHELCSLFASIDLCDEVRVLERVDAEGDRVICPGVEGNDLCATALEELRSDPDVVLPPLEVTIEKRIPIAAGLGGGSADAAATLRAANDLAGRPLDDDALRGLGARVGADVPSQIEPRHALVTGGGERVEPVDLPAMALVLVPSREGLSTAEVYAHADRVGAAREELDPAAARALAREPLERLAPALRNDLQVATLSLRPELGAAIDALEDAGAMTALVTGSGPTVFGVFATRDEAERAADAVSEEISGPSPIVVGLRG